MTSIALAPGDLVDAGVDVDDRADEVARDVVVAARTMSFQSCRHSGRVQL